MATVTTTAKSRWRGRERKRSNSSNYATKEELGKLTEGKKGEGRIKRMECWVMKKKRKQRKIQLAK